RADYRCLYGGAALSDESIHHRPFAVVPTVGWEAEEGLPLPGQAICLKTRYLSGPLLIGRRTSPVFWK
ncbi:hypothetical protein ACFLYR_08745, partial [Chloroflexota bacterium]